MLSDKEGMWDATLPFSSILIHVIIASDNCDAPYPPKIRIIQKKLQLRTKITGSLVGDTEDRSISIHKHQASWAVWPVSSNSARPLGYGVKSRERRHAKEATLPKLCHWKDSSSKTWSGCAPSLLSIFYIPELINPTTHLIMLPELIVLSLMKHVSEINSFGSKQFQFWNHWV